jgi:predicted HD superfamily hydrolase involved in NAD metabolism
MADPADDRRLRERMLPELPASMADHIDRVVALADELAKRHGLDVARVRLAAQGHDLLRAVPPAELLERAEARGLPIDPVERAAPVMLHGPLGALELEERFGLDDAGVLHAIRWHTPGHPEYSREAWAMFVADKVEPEKVAATPALQPIRELADESLEAAALAYLDLRLEQAVSERLQVHPMATLSRNALIRQLDGAAGET